MENIHLHNHRGQWTPRRVKLYLHPDNSCKNVERQRQFLKIARVAWSVRHKGIPGKLTPDFSLQTTEAIRRMIHSKNWSLLWGTDLILVLLKVQSPPLWSIAGLASYGQGCTVVIRTTLPLTSVTSNFFLFFWHPGSQLFRIWFSVCVCVCVCVCIHIA